MAGAMLDVEVSDSQVGELLAKLAERMGDLRTPLEDIREYLHQSTDERFRQQVGPDGSPWAPLAPSTLARKKGPRTLRESGDLQDTLRGQVQGDELLFGTDRPYGAVHQFGQRAGASGRNRRGSPIPWGDIPARPYLGLSAEDETEVLAIVESWLLVE
ncbi:putative Phage virion morphogenesis (tail completion) protein [Pseudomonas sp. 8Z]|uniref:phage virion morphogenesis protein n=1 Tax=Pseudomonas sp. 8Z TaxID=2653166 RepID=UPI0012F0C376|nr:phage virion morphogenesis protein [Pseudomonas sp. 8Z]VXC72103.1 putative Phage virion morphogenesis (tail completion) protein [Pseudomonas sp. 8Z]